MKLVCEKYKEEMESDFAVCRHPVEYCKFRKSCIIHFISKEKQSGRDLNREKKNAEDSENT